MGLFPRQQQTAEENGYRIGFHEGLAAYSEGAPVDETDYGRERANVAVSEYVKSHWRGAGVVAGGGRVSAENFSSHVKSSFLRGYDDGFEDGLLAASEGVTRAAATRWKRPEVVDRAKDLAKMFLNTYGIDGKVVARRHRWVRGEPGAGQFAYDVVSFVDEKVVLDPNNFANKMANWFTKHGLRVRSYECAGSIGKRICLSKNFEHMHRIRVTIWT